MVLLKVTDIVSVSRFNKLPFRRLEKKAWYLKVSLPSLNFTRPVYMRKKGETPKALLPNKN